MCNTLAARAAQQGTPVARAALDDALLTLYAPTAPHLTLAQEKLTTQQEKILQQIITDSQGRKKHYAAATRRHARPPEPHQTAPTPGPRPPLR
ncbi:hypothetical protein [Streptomyces olivaceus]|uniref:hypothetical protein n=1 Tax=Streptomyces olivaceus TaxID=47716 RepID=UPI003679DF8A